MFCKVVQRCNEQKAAHLVVKAAADVCAVNRRDEREVLPVFSFQVFIIQVARRTVPASTSTCAPTLTVSALSTFPALHLAPGHPQARLESDINEAARQSCNKHVCTSLDLPPSLTLEGSSQTRWNEVTDKNSKSDPKHRLSAVSHD